MAIKRVKQKFPISTILAVLACVTFLASWGQIFPRNRVESVYARAAFPAISRVFAVMADVLPASWLDLWIATLIGILIYGVLRRRFRLLIGAAAFFYLWFFWGWGVNYHRPPVAERLHLQDREVRSEEVNELAAAAAKELNRLWPIASQSPLERDAAARIAFDRVERVVFRMDGVDWPITHRVKRSLLLEPWYLAAGIDGMFNPFGHEPIVVRGPLPFELPFLMAHEIAHARGIANEGEANLIAILATLASDDPRFQYSGWLELWSYVADPKISLDPGPKADLAAARQRILAQRIAFIRRAQTAMLDVHLKANAVPGGIRSYADLVRLAILSRPRWQEFR